MSDQVFPDEIVLLIALIWGSVPLFLTLTYWAIVIRPHRKSKPEKSDPESKP